MSVLTSTFLIGFFCLLLSLPRIANAQVFATSGFNPVTGTNQVIGFCSTSTVLDGVTSAAGTKNANDPYPYSEFYAYCDVTGGGNTYSARASLYDCAG